MPAQWTPPSAEKAKRLPQIDIAENNLVQKYLDWYNDNPGIPRTVPPLYPDFCLSFSRSYGDRTYSYTEIVHYDSDMCGFHVCHMIDGKKVCTVHSRYEDYNGTTVHASLFFPPTTRYSRDWLRNEGTSIVCTVLAVQMYILYHRPELIPVELPEPAQHHTGKAASPRPTATITDTKRVYIRLTASDPQPRETHYQKIQWQVRGHYRHLQSGKLIYIKPHAAHRGYKKTRPKIEMQ